MGFWTHYVQTIAGQVAGDAVREFTQFHVPAGSTLLRTIVDVAVADQILFTPGTGQPPKYPVMWALGDSNSDITPHFSDNPDACSTEGVHLIAHGLVSIAYHPFVTINAYNGDTTNPPFPAHGSISGAPSQEITMYLSGRDHVDSQAQRTFPDANPRLCLSVQQFCSSIPYDDQAPRTVFSIRQLWNHGSL